MLFRKKQPPTPPPPPYVNVNIVMSISKTIQVTYYIGVLPSKKQVYSRLRKFNS